MSLFRLGILMRKCVVCGPAFLTNAGTPVTWGSIFGSDAALGKHYITPLNETWLNPLMRRVFRGWHVVNKGENWDFVEHRSRTIRRELQLCFQKAAPICLLRGGGRQCFQTLTDLFEAGIWASSSPLVMNPTRAEVMREQREREGWQEWTQQVERGERPIVCVVIFLSIFHQIREIV